MTANEPVIVFLATSVCILIFLATVALMGYFYKKDETRPGILLAVVIVMGMVNMFLTMQFLWVAMSVASGIAGVVMGAILAHVYGVQPQTSKAVANPPPARKVRG